MVAVITERKKQTWRDQRTMLLQVAQVEAQTVGIAVAGLGQSKKQQKAIAKSVMSMDFVKMFLEAEKKTAEEDRLPSTMSVMRRMGVSPKGLAGVSG